MIRRLLTFAVLAGLLVGATVWLADRPGSVTVRWEGWRVDTTVPVLLLAVLVLVAAVQTVLRLAGAVVHGPGRFLARRRARRHEAGYRALSDGMAALAAGDQRQARRLAKRADRLLADPSLTALLSAQTAGGAVLALDPNLQRKVLDDLQGACEAAMAEGLQPVVLCGPPLRLPLRKLLERYMAHVPVMAYNEVSAKADVEFVGQVAA